MPNFPSYRGELPEILSPLNLRHYWLLAYWVYFRPTAFHCYLHRAAPDAHQLSGYRKLLKIWSIPAYRNVYLMLPLAIVLPTILLGLSIFMYVQSGVQNDTAWVNAIAVTPNGQIAVTASGERDFDVKIPTADGTLQVWDLRQGKQIQTLIGHEQGVTTVAVTPDGQKAVSASRDQTVRIWDIRRGTQLHNLQGHQLWVTNVAVTPDGQRAISAAADKTLKVWDLQKGQEVHTLTGHSDIVWAVAVTPDGKQAVSASADQTLKVWDIEQGKELYTLTGHKGWVTGVAIGPDGEQAVSISADNTLKVWDIRQGKELYALTGHSGWVTDVAVSPDGQHVVSSSTDRTLRVWDIEQGKSLYTLAGHNGWVTSVAVSSDGQRAVSASADQTLKVWDIEQGKALHTLKGHHSWITAIAVIPNKRRVLSGSFDRYPKLWSLNSGTQLAMTGEITKTVTFNVAFGIVLILAALTTLVSVAIILAMGAIAFSATGAIVSGLLLIFLGSPVCAFVFLVVARIGVNPLLKDAVKAIYISNALTVVFGILFGLIVGVTFGLANRKALGVFASIVSILMIALAVGILVACVLTGTISFKGRYLPAIRAITAIGIGFNLWVILGALRIPFYPFELVLALLSRFRTKWHPALWDELLVLPVPRTSALLRTQLRSSELKGLQLATDVARNPFQRASAQRSLHSYLHSTAAPLHVLYHLLRCEDVNSYILAPSNKVDWQLLPTTSQVLLGELANQRVASSSDSLSQFAENLVEGLTWLGRKHQRTPLTRFAGLLCQLSYTQTVNAKEFNLFSYEKIYCGLTQYPGGTEIADSFEVLAIFLTYDNLSDLSGAGDVVSGLSVDETAIRPEVLTVLTRCGAIGAEVLAYQASATPIEQLAILARITSTLNRLDEYVVKQVVISEQVILRRIIRQWQAIVSQAMADAGNKLD